jgi:hypothetical protein
MGYVIYIYISPNSIFQMKLYSKEIRYVFSVIFLHIFLSILSFFLKKKIDAQIQWYVDLHIIYMEINTYVYENKNKHFFED